MCNLCREQEQIELAAWKALGIPLASEHAIAETPVTDEALDQARLDLLDQRGYEGLEQWEDLLKDIGRPEEEVLDRLRRVGRDRVVLEPGEARQDDPHVRPCLCMFSLLHSASFPSFAFLQFQK